MRIQGNSWGNDIIGGNTTDWGIFTFEELKGTEDFLKWANNATLGDWYVVSDDHIADILWFCTNKKDVDY